jgi:hypothetical protein
MNLLNLLFVLTDILDDPLHFAVDIDQPDTFDANIVLMNMMRDLGLFKSPQAHRFEDLQLNLLFLLCSVELRNFT